MRLYIAGADSDQWLKLMMAANHPYLLGSFYNGLYQEASNARWVDWFHRLKKCGAEFIMDSGLFTMMFGTGKDYDWQEGELIEYTHRYLDTMRAIRFEDVVVEMDVQKLLGQEVHQRFRKIFEKSWDLEKTIYVWHLEDGIDGWRKICKRYPWVALSIPELKWNLGLIEATKLIDSAIKIGNQINPNIKIHLLGCSTCNLLKREGYYSTDSTSWLSGAKYAAGGGHRIFDGGRIRTPPRGIHGLDWPPYKRALERTYRQVYQIVKPKNKRSMYYVHACTGITQYALMNAWINRKFFNNEPIPKLWHQKQKASAN